MTEARGKVGGARDGHQIVFYGLSTCIWCKRARRFLEEEGIAFEFIYVDLLEGDEREAAVGEIREWNAAVSFPTIVIDGKQCVVGYKTDELAEVLGL